MAGTVRQPIDVPALERYIDQNVPIIKTPLEVKQVTQPTDQTAAMEPTREERTNAHCLVS